MSCQFPDARASRYRPELQSGTCACVDVAGHLRPVSAKPPLPLGDYGTSVFTQLCHAGSLLGKVAQCMRGTEMPSVKHSWHAEVVLSMPGSDLSPGTLGRLCPMTTYACRHVKAERACDREPAWHW